MLVEEKHDSIPLKISDGPYAVKENGEVLPYAEYVYETNVKKGVITMTQTEAQKRAQKKYRAKLKWWNVLLTPELYNAIETKRKEDGLTRKQVLERYLNDDGNH